MTKVTMPEPAAEIVLFGGTLKEVAWQKGRMPKEGTKFITTDQAEAYKDACVREALELAAETCTNTMMMNTDSFCGATAHYCADRIRALLPQ